MHNPKIQSTCMASSCPTFRSFSLHIHRQTRPSIRPKKFIYEYDEMHQFIKVYTFRNDRIRRATLQWMREKINYRLFTILPINK